MNGRRSEPTLESLLKEAQAASAREVADLERALWVAVHADEVLADPKTQEDSAFVAQMEEAKKLAERICLDRCAWVEKLLMQDMVDRLRKAAI